MHDWNGMESNEGAKISVKHRPVNEMPVGVWTVEYQEGNVIFRTSLPSIMHCGYVSVKARAHILDVKNEEVDFL